MVHEAVRDSIAGFLRVRTPPLSQLQTGRVARVKAEMSETAPAEFWRYTADLLYLIDNPVVREAFFPSDAQPLAVEPGRRDEPRSAPSCDGTRHRSGRALERWMAGHRRPTP